VKGFIAKVKEGTATEQHFGTLSDQDRQYATLAFLADRKTPLPPWLANRVARMRDRAKDIERVTPNSEWDKDLLSVFAQAPFCRNPTVEVLVVDENEPEVSAEPSPEVSAEPPTSTTPVPVSSDDEHDEELRDQTGHGGRTEQHQSSTGGSTGGTAGGESTQPQHGSGSGQPSGTQPGTGGGSGSGGDKPPGKGGKRGDDQMDVDLPDDDEEEHDFPDEDMKEEEVRTLNCVKAFKIDLSAGKTASDAARSIFRNVVKKSNLCNTLERERGDGEAASSVRLPCDPEAHLYPLYESLPMIIGVAAGVVGSDGKVRGVLVPTLALSTAPQGHCMVIALEQGMNPPPKRELDWETEAPAVNAAMKVERDRTIHYVRTAFAVGESDAERNDLRATVPVEWQPNDPAEGDSDEVKALKTARIATLRKRRKALLAVLNIKDLTTAKNVIETLDRHVDSAFLSAHAIAKNRELQQLRYTNNTTQLLGEIWHDSDKLAGVAAANVAHRHSATTGERVGLARFHPTFDVDLGEKSGQELFYSRVEHEHIMSTSGHADALLPMPRLLAAYNHPYANFLPAALVPATLCAEPNLYWTHALTFRDSNAVRQRVEGIAAGRLDTPLAATWTIRSGQVFCFGPAAKLKQAEGYWLVVATGVRFSQSLYDRFDSLMNEKKLRAPASSSPADVVAWEQLRELDPAPDPKKMFSPVALAVRLPDESIDGELDAHGYLADETLRQIISDLPRPNESESAVEAINAEQLASDGRLCEGVTLLRIRPPSGANLIERNFYEVDNTRLGLGWIVKEAPLLQRKPIDPPQWVEDAVVEFALDRATPPPAVNLSANDGWHAFYKRCYEDATTNKLNSKVVELLEKLSVDAQHPPPPSRMLVESQVLPVADNDRYNEDLPVTLKPYFVAKEGAASRTWVKEHAAEVKERNAKSNQPHRFQWVNVLREDVLLGQKTHAENFDELVKYLREEVFSNLKDAQMKPHKKNKANLQGLLVKDDQEGNTSPVRSLYKLAVATVSTNPSHVYSFVRNVLVVFDKQAYVATLLMDTAQQLEAFSQPYPQAWRKEHPYNSVPATDRVLFDPVAKEGQPDDFDDVPRTDLNTIVSLKPLPGAVDVEMEDDSRDRGTTRSNRGKGSKPGDAQTTSSSGKKRGPGKMSGGQSSRRNVVDHVNQLVLPPLGPPRNAGRKLELQYYNSRLNHERGLKYNCAQLGLEIVDVDPVIGRGVKATLSFPKGQRVGFYWGWLIDHKQYVEMSSPDAKEKFPVEAGQEDFITPLQEGIWRGIETNEGTLIGSAQCPMSFINHTNEKAKINVSLDLSADVFDETDGPHGYKSFRIYATRNIAVGDLLWANYNWKEADWEQVTALREKARKAALTRTSGTRSDHPTSTSAPPPRCSLTLEEVTEHRDKRPKVITIADVLRSDEVQRMIAEQVRQKVAAAIQAKPSGGTPAQQPQQPQQPGGSGVAVPPRRSPRHGDSQSNVGDSGQVGGPGQVDGRLTVTGSAPPGPQAGPPAASDTQQSVQIQQQSLMFQQMQEQFKKQQEFQQKLMEQQQEQQKSFGSLAELLKKQFGSVTASAGGHSPQSPTPAAVPAHSSTPVAAPAQSSTPAAASSGSPNISSALVANSNSNTRTVPAPSTGMSSNSGSAAPNSFVPTALQHPFGNHMAAFQAQDSERLIISEYESAKAMRALSRNADQQRALERDEAQRQLDQFSRSSHQNGYQLGYAAAAAELYQRFAPNGSRSS
jgi:hypothetical protein